MRIIAGRARGKKLIEFSGSRVRPTSDRVREALFSILISRRGSLCGCNVLDLYSGTGALGLEALSRGAKKALLVDCHPESTKIIKGNITGCHMEDCASVWQAELPEGLKILIKEAPFDLIFMDPPYAQGLALATLEKIEELNILSPDGFIVSETPKEEVLPKQIRSLIQSDQRHYGVTAITLYERMRLPA